MTKCQAKHPTGVQCQMKDGHHGDHFAYVHPHKGLLWKREEKR